MCETRSTDNRFGLDGWGEKSILNLRLTNFAVTLLILVSVMSPTSAAPSPYVIAANPPNHQAVHSSLFSNPCGQSEISSGTIKHTLLDSLKNVKDKLNMTLSEFKRLNSTSMAMIYESTLNLTKQFKDHDLPTKQFQEFVNYKHKNPNLGSEKMVPHVLSKLREKLLHYGDAIMKLLRMIPQTESAAHIKEHRNVVINKLKYRLQDLLCEVEASINDSTSAIPANLEHTLSHFGKDWPENPNLISLLTTDMSIFVQYKSFLEDWLKIIREVDSLARKDRKKRKNKKKAKINKKRNARPRAAIRHQRNSLHHRKL